MARHVMLAVLLLALPGTALADAASGEDLSTAKSVVDAIEEELGR